MYMQCSSCNIMNGKHTTTTIKQTAAVTWKLGSETVLVFGPESVSYERSRHENWTILREISARVFFVKIPKIKKNHISNISRIWENWKNQISNISRIWGSWKTQISNISRLIDNVADFNFQYFQDRTEYGSYDPIFPGYEEVEKLRFPIFPGYEEVEKIRFPISLGL